MGVPSLISAPNSRRIAPLPARLPVAETVRGAVAKV